MAYNENFFVNEVLMDMSAGSRYRLLWISQGGEECWWITLDGSKRVPERVSVHELDTWKESGRIVRAEDPADPAPALTRDQKKRRDKRYEIIKDAVTREPEIYRLRGVYPIKNDPYGKSRYIYTFRNRCDEDFEILRKDEATKIGINTKGTVGDIGEDLKAVISYMILVPRQRNTQKLLTLRWRITEAAKDYSKTDWAWTLFDPEAKKERHETVFPEEI